MAAQIEAGKLVQEADFKRWQEEGRGEFSEVRDLATDLRPALDELSADLLELLGELAPRLESDDVRATLRERAVEILQGDGIGDEVRATAIRPLAPE
jgi:chorismate mutase